MTSHNMHSASGGSDSHPEGRGSIASGAEEAHEVAEKGDGAGYKCNQHYICGAVRKPHQPLVRNAIPYLQVTCSLLLIKARLFI